MNASQYSWARRGAVRLVGLAAIAVACAPSRIVQQPPAATQLRVTATEFKFQSSTARVAAGQPVTITFENTGTIEHNFHLEATGTHLIAAPGQTVSATVVFPASGDFGFVCSVPGHQAAGMDGRFQAGDALPTTALSGSSSAQASNATPVADAQLSPLPPGTTRVPQGQVAPPLDRRVPALVKVDLVIKQVVGTLADGVGFNYWTFRRLRARADDSGALSSQRPLRSARSPQTR